MDLGNLSQLLDENFKDLFCLEIVSSYNDYPDLDVSHICAFLLQALNVSWKFISLFSF